MASSGGGGVIGMRSLNPGPWDTADPFLFAVYHDDMFPPGTSNMGPDKSLLKGRRIGSDFGNPKWNMYHGETVPGFPKHPHRGFETVTVVRHGLIDHTDSLGATGRFGGGDCQWMTAGAGISHSEMFPLIDTVNENRLELFQIWLNLPKKNKMEQPHFKMMWAEDIPHVLTTDSSGRETEVTLIAGALGGQSAPQPPPASWAADPDNAVAIWTVRMAPDACWELPAGPPGASRMLYCFHGGNAGAKVGGRAFPAGRLAAAELRSDVAVQLQAGSTETEFLMLQGRPIGEPVVSHGPFVMTSQAEIRQAFSDYQRTEFGGWPWPSESVAHPRTQGRFARYPDGHTDTPGRESL
eukprot:TRINITY_DN90229_c0_g1_i1.p1 TRINITY_DN90229_c0_g1~~TRINITY_DN90229_c0_g1_i1.p1  ORF type:complete len:363 (+),score=21.59 TRINITY_DN90229_c0_g1_i1:34-1089(+)